MAEWSQLPEELLHRIATQLTSHIDLLRFRSVCSSWRSSIYYPPHSFPHRIPIRPSTGTDSTSFHLSKRVILRLSSPHHRGWIIKLEQDDPEMSHLLNPLSESKIQPLPTNFPKVFNLIDVQISELGQEFVLRYAERPPFGFAGDVYKEKVVFSLIPSLWSSEIEYAIMTIHVSGKLALFRLKDNTWYVIEDMPNPYDDVICYKGQFYAVDTTGRTVVVGHSLAVTEVASSVFGGDKKYLVELDGELLLVDRYLRFGSDDQPIYYEGIQDYEVFVPNDDTYTVDTTVEFKVFKLDRWEKNWVEVKSLGGHMLFLGDNCSFSASASDFNQSKENCIYFTDGYLPSNREEGGLFKGQCIGVFNLEDCSIGPLASYPGYYQLFWPPPMWVTPASS